MSLFLHVFRSARADEFIAIPCAYSEISAATIESSLRAGSSIALTGDSIAMHIKSTTGPRRLWADVIVHR